MEGWKNGKKEKGTRIKDRGERLEDGRLEAKPKEQGSRIKVKRGRGKGKDLKNRDVLANISSDDNFIQALE